MRQIARCSRRRLLGLSGTALTVAVAGCTSSGGSGDDGDGGQRLRPEDWEDVSEIELEGAMNGWFGLAPDLIAGVRNPGILLFEGEEYDITWENIDGMNHNLAIRDEGNSVVDGYNTGYLRHRGETATMTVEATESMHTYVCDPHPRSMIGYIGISTE